MSYILYILSARVIVGRTSLPSPSFPIYPPLIAKLEEARSEDREETETLVPSLPPSGPRVRVRESPSYIRSSPGNFSIFPPNIQGLLRSKKASFPIRRRSSLSPWVYSQLSYFLWKRGRELEKCGAFIFCLSPRSQSFMWRQFPPLFSADPRDLPTTICRPFLFVDKVISVQHGRIVLAR